MTTLHEARVYTHYRPEMAPPEARSFSKSPTKPTRFMDFLRQTPVWSRVLQRDVEPVTRAQLLTAHRPGYVDAVLTGIDSGPWGGDHESNGIKWSRAFRDSVLLTNGSLLGATRAAYATPSQIHLSPTSGFHHATPAAGQGFCTFSGQVIAALDLWRSHGARGAWIDLDGHYGNSIEDSRTFCPDLDQAIPTECNLNPEGTHETYIASLREGLAVLGARVLAGTVDYVCVALGADSHVWDQLGGQVDTDEWIACVDMVFESVRAWSSCLERPIPVVLSLFGGYRDDHPESVLGLHAMGVARALYWLGGERDLERWRADVRPRGAAR